jgi:hypothetical protein
VARYLGVVGGETNKGCLHAEVLLLGEGVEMGVKNAEVRVIANESEI